MLSKFFYGFLAVFGSENCFYIREKDIENLKIFIQSFLRGFITKKYHRALSYSICKTEKNFLVILLLPPIVCSSTMKLFKQKRANSILFEKICIQLVQTEKIKYYPIWKIFYLVSFKKIGSNVRKIVVEITHD